MGATVQRNHASTATGVVVFHVDNNRRRRLHDTHDRPLREHRVQRKERRLNAQTAIVRLVLGIVGAIHEEGEGAASGRRRGSRWGRLPPLSRLAATAGWGDWRAKIESTTSPL